MSSLIIGACFIVALITLIALVFVIRSGSRSLPQTTNESSLATPSTRLEMPKIPASAQESMPQVVSTTESAHEHHTYVLNGQFHELAVGLHTLREQSQEMEQRLSMLTMMIESVERSQNDL